MFGLFKKIISDDQLVNYCSALTGKTIRKRLGTPFVRRNSQRETKKAESSRSIGLPVYKRECYDLVLDYEGHDLFAAHQNDSELIVLEWTYDGLPFPTGMLQIDSEERWGLYGVSVALNNMEVEYSHVRDSFESDHLFGVKEVEMACEVAKWIMAKGLRTGASVAHTAVNRKNYQPAPPLSTADLTNLLDLLDLE